MFYFIAKQWRKKEEKKRCGMDHQAWIQSNAARKQNETKWEDSQRRNEDIKTLEKKTQTNMQQKNY